LIDDNENLAGANDFINTSSNTFGNVKVTHNFQSSVTAIPLPSALKAGLPLLLCLGIFSLMKTAKKTFNW
jgi:hypothetical protein